MKRGEIYYIENNNAVGSEQGGRRPAVIVGNDVGNKYSPVLLVVYFTLQPKKTLPTHVYVRGHGTALCEQIFTVDRTRLLQKRENVQIAIWNVSIKHFAYRLDWRKHGKT